MASTSQVSQQTEQTEPYCQPIDPAGQMYRLRRTERVGLSAQCHPTTDDLNKDRDGFTQKCISVKGRSVFSTRNFLRNEFLLIYHGELISNTEANKREAIEETGFRYFFTWKGQNLCVDATEEPSPGQPSLGRLVNHGEKREINCRMKVVELLEKPRLCIFAMKDISANTELLYDYGLPKGFKFPPPFYNSPLDSMEHCKQDNPQKRVNFGSCYNNEKENSSHYAETDNVSYTKSSDVSMRNDNGSIKSANKDKISTECIPSPQSARTEEADGSSSGMMEGSKEDSGEESSGSSGEKILADIMANVCRPEDDSDHGSEADIPNRRCMKASVTSAIPINPDRSNCVNIAELMSSIMSRITAEHNNFTECPLSKSVGQGQGEESSFVTLKTANIENHVTSIQNSEEEKSCGTYIKAKTNGSLETASSPQDTSEDGDSVEEIVSESSYAEMSDVIPHRIPLSRRKEVDKHAEVTDTFEPRGSEENEMTSVHVLDKKSRDEMLLAKHQNYKQAGAKDDKISKHTKSVHMKEKVSNDKSLLGSGVEINGDSACSKSANDISDCSVAMDVSCAKMSNNVVLRIDNDSNKLAKSSSAEYICLQNSVAEDKEDEGNCGTKEDIDQYSDKSNESCAEKILGKILSGFCSAAEESDHVSEFVIPESMYIRVSASDVTPQKIDSNNLGIPVTATLDEDVANLANNEGEKLHGSYDEATSSPGDPGEDEDYVEEMFSESGSAELSDDIPHGINVSKCKKVDEHTALKNISQENRTEKIQKTSSNNLLDKNSEDEHKKDVENKHSEKHMKYIKHKKSGHSEDDGFLPKHHHYKRKKYTKHKKSAKNKKSKIISEESSVEDSPCERHCPDKYKKRSKHTKYSKHKKRAEISGESCTDESSLKKHHCCKSKRDTKHKKSVVMSEESSGEESSFENHSCGKQRKCTNYKQLSKQKSTEMSEESSGDEILKKHHSWKNKKTTKQKNSRKHKKSVIMSKGTKGAETLFKKHRYGGQKKSKKSSTKHKESSTVYKKLTNKLDVTPTSEDDSSDGEVQIVRKKDGKRVWNKKDYCFFCSKGDLKIARHWSIWHKEETLVKEIEDLPKSSKPRSEKIAYLRRKGNLKHNLTVWETGVGKIVPRKRPCYEQDATEYLPCEFCLGSFKREWLSLHQKTCGPKHGREKLKRAQSAAKMIIPDKVSTESVSDSLKAKVLSRMQSDDITADVRRDSAILAYGSRLIKSHPEEHQALIVSQKMRDLAKLVRAARKKDPSIVGLKQCIDPNKFDTVVSAVRIVAGYSGETESYKTPSYARNIGFELDKVVNQLSSEAIKHKDKILAKNVSEFRDIKLASWSHEVTCVAHQTLQKRKRNRPNLIPLADDIKKLTNHLKGHMEIYEEELKKEPTSTKNWLELCQATLASVSLFNKRRSGETERLLIEDYKRGCNEDTEVPQEVFQSLSELEKALVMKLTRIEVRGKRDRTVPILLTKDMVSRIDLLNQTRETVGVDDRVNPYVFARPYYESRFAAKVSECYQKFSKQCGAQNPESIRSTKLRKHIAIMSQLLCLKENELDLLAGYMGHDVRIHREFYRLPESTLQLAKISKLLIMMEKGITSGYKGKSLDQINIPLDESTAEDDDNDACSGDDGGNKGNISPDGASDDENKGKIPPRGGGGGEDKGNKGTISPGGEGLSKSKENQETCKADDGKDDAHNGDGDGNKGKISPGGDDEGNEGNCSPGSARLSKSLRNKGTGKGGKVCRNLLNTTSGILSKQLMDIFPPFLEKSELSKWLLEPEKEQQGQAVFKFEIFLPDDDPEIWLADNTGSYIDSQLPILPSYGSTPDQVSTVNLGSLLKTMDVISHSPNDQWLMCVRFDYFQQVSEQDDSEWLLHPTQQLMRSQEQEEEMEEGETISRLQEANQDTDPVISQEVISKGHQSIQAGMKQAPPGKRCRDEPASQTPSQNATSGKRTRKK